MSHLKVPSFPVIVAAGVLIASLAACEDPPKERPPSPADTLAKTTATRSLLAQQRDRWQASAVSDYRFTFVRHIAQSPSSTNPVIVTVRNGSIAAARFESAPKIVKVEPEKRKHLPTIDSLFAFVRHTADEGADSLRVRYDAETGFPYAIFVDPNRKKTNDEVEIEVKDFVPLAPKDDQK